MIALLALLTLATPEPRLEAALFVPPPGGVVLENQVVLHDAQRGLTLVPNVAAAAVESFLDGTAGRLVSAGIASLSGGPSSLRLPLGSGEMSYVGLRDGHPQAMTVLNPAAVTIDIAQPAEKKPAGRSRLLLTFKVVQLEAQTNVPELENAAVGAPVFRRSQVSVEQSLVPDQPLVVLLAAETSLRVGERELDVTFRGQVGNRTVEAAAPLLGVVLRLIPPGGEPRYSRLSPPIAPPGQVAVAGEVPKPGLQTFEPGMQATTALGNAGAAPPAELEIARLSAAGVVERLRVQVTGQDDVALQERDRVAVVGQRGGGPAGPAGMSAMPAPPAPAAAAPAAAATRAERSAAEQRPGPPTQQLQKAGPGPLTGSLLLDDLARIAPAAASAAAASVALRGHATRDGGTVEILMCGTILAPDGLIVTAPAASLEGVRDLRAQLSDGRELPCRRVGVDPTGALLALRVEATGLPALRLATPQPEPGTPVVVIGHPYGLVRSVALTVVGGPARSLPQAAGAELQLDGALAAGNSGGPVVDLAGRLLGLAYGTLTTPEPGPAVSLAVPATVVAEALKGWRGASAK